MHSHRPTATHSHAANREVLIRSPLIWRMREARPTALHSCRCSIGKDAENIPAVTPLFDPMDLDSVMLAFSRVAVLLLVAVEVCGVVSPDVVAHPPPGGDEVSRMLAA